MISTDNLQSRSNLGLYATLLPPLLWMTLLYFLPLALLLAYSFWRLESFEIVKEFSWVNFRTIFTNSAYQTVILRTLLTALSVTLIDIVIALPLGYWIAQQRSRSILTLLVILPLWSSYLVRVFAWKIILGYSGLLNGLLLAVGILQQPSSIFLYNSFSTTLTFVHLWLPFMILPIVAAFERLPANLLEASADLNAPPMVTFRRVTLPLVMPGILAGSINVFSLTVGDFITPSLVGGSNGILLGNLISSQFGVAYNWPLGAALALVVMLIVLLGLAVVLRQGGLEN
ncbi:MAG: ABC transporter permease [Pegethrix bostrychoides GSE-TBD4-15B]|uniref:ABC transporter permease n=1 Tax=Pegethrix bostrychoides GSE-TBD4-15B TaxID=2839662 RepID=A0A951P8H7_9CYAN|nr:ABC transporter permease [Pegethrix bostrychoides GSE-TBD4-15B]